MTLKVQYKLIALIVPLDLNQLICRTGRVTVTIF